MKSAKKRKRVCKEIKTDTTIGSSTLCENNIDSNIVSERLILLGQNQDSLNRAVIDKASLSDCLIDLGG